MDSLLAVRRDLLHHVTSFNGLNDDRETFDRLIRKYRKKTVEWSSAGNTATILKHAVHVAAWIVFGERDFGRSREERLACCTDLLCEMLVARSGVTPTPRLIDALRYVEELCQDFEGEAWATRSLEEVSKAVIAYDRSFLHSHLGERAESSAARARGQTNVPPFTHGRTDQALVRSILGERYWNLPPKTKIYWDGRQQRWYASSGKGNIRGSNAMRNRFASDEEAIKFVASVLGI